MDAISMTAVPSQHGQKAGGAAAFATTHWSLVLRAGQDSGSGSDAALEQLCRAYWYPLYAFVRRAGHSPHDAEDLTQAFFAYLLEKRLVAKADSETGRFRSFLIGAFRNFLANEWRHRHAQKRNAAQTVPLETGAVEDRYTQEPADTADPLVLFEKAWAVAVLDQAMAQLASEHTAAGKERLFRELQVFLQGDRGPRTYAAIGTDLGLSEGAVKVAVHRMRLRYRELLRATVANTVADPLEVDAELRHLLHVLNR
jgi:RNA polymerase sigma-70 factor (ECF subfamily)